MSEANAVLEVVGLTRTYQSRAGVTEALRGLTFTIKRGEFVAIMGPSGSGKSTLMNILGCLDRPSKGLYLFEGVDIRSYDDDELADIRATRIGFIFQAFNLLPRTTVLRNVMLPLSFTHCPQHEWEARARKALHAVDLQEYLYGHRSNELSGGQMQRVAIARALVNDPALILADEPTGNLDTATGAVILATLTQLHERGRTIVLITHDPEVARRADRILHIRDGLLERTPHTGVFSPADSSTRGETASGSAAYSGVSLPAVASVALSA
ncbi:MAG: ABC transporter ATP-binding protein [Coriobacteriales bacterium]|jgi:putative ABC transport system ATP-binding protein|nr:ABC transporter ATP-binding protein [Coriobacteriales bacterium]